jgi:M6 family metalloprotease-like protein
MKKKQKIGLAALLAAATLSISAGIFSMSANALIVLTGYRGDLNGDDAVTIADVVKLQRYLLQSDDLSEEANDIGWDTVAERADLNNDNAVNIIDLLLLKRCVLTTDWMYTWEELPDSQTTTSETTTTVTTTTTTTTTTEATTASTTESTTAPTTTTTTTAYSYDYDFMNASITALKASLPSQGEANLVIFYVDFPDCKYSVDLTADQIQEIAFGEEDTSDSNYPFDSMTAFYGRSSKGAMQLNGKVFRYTTKENQSAYDNDKVKLAEECYEAFKDSEDFSQYDGDNDGMIDATLFSVPTAAGDDNWWPCAGGFGDSTYKVDGVSIGHIITGNAQIESETDYANFNSSYLHEMGHCMGLPDYYLYYSGDDFDAMVGNAGTELMDGDAASDFGCFSKLMLGWYRTNQVSVYDSSQGTQTFTLNNAQSDDGNCVIIPYGDLDDNYFSEYLMIEYVTEDANNSYINSHMWWWQSIDSGIRVYHINATFQDDFWYPCFKYQNGAEATGYNDSGIRLIRLANEAEGGSVFKTGAVIDGNISGFHWYDSSENESVDTGVTVTVGDLVDGKYTITVSNAS